MLLLFVGEAELAVAKAAAGGGAAWGCCRAAGCGFCVCDPHGMFIMALRLVSRLAQHPRSCEENSFMGCSSIAILGEAAIVS